MLGVYDYHQFDNWMVSPGFMEFLSAGPVAALARQVFPDWAAVRVLKESLFYRPRARHPALLAPLHIDCETGQTSVGHFSDADTAFCYPLYLLGPIATTLQVRAVAPSFPSSGCG